MIDGKPYSSHRYEQVLKEQLLIASLSKGAITLSETSQLPINDRKILLNTLRQAKETEKKRIEEMREKRKLRNALGKN